MLKTICEGSETHVPVKHSERVSIQNVPIYITTKHEMERNLREACDMEAMRTRIHILRPMKYDRLKDKPYLHPAVWIHGIDYAANKLAQKEVPRPIQEEIVNTMSETQEIQDLIDLADADTEEFECNNELGMLQTPDQETQERIVISPNRDRVKRALIKEDMYNPEEEQQTVQKKVKKMTHLCADIAKYLYDTECEVSTNSISEMIFQALKVHRPTKQNLLHDVDYESEFNARLHPLLQIDLEDESEEI